MNSTTVPPIEVHDLTVQYQSKPALWAVDCDFPQGSVSAIVGPNGAGKSTLMKAILGLVPLASGYVRVFGEPLSKRYGTIAYVPQREEIDWDFPITVRDVVRMGRYARLPFWRRMRRSDKEICEHALEQVGMIEFAKRQISQLSGGQQQRVFIARALAQQPAIYLMDEPLAGVDVSTEEKILELFSELRTKGKTIICVHHDLETVAKHFDWVLLLNQRLVAAGALKETLTEKNLQAAYGGSLGALAEVAAKLGQREWKGPQ